MAQDKPNILLIFTDQHRLSTAGCYGKTPCLTPQIDRLASEGVRFEIAYTGCPVRSPARATIMTGLYPHSYGRSIVPLLQGETVQWRNSVCVEFSGVNPLAKSMVRVRHKALKYGWNLLQPRRTV